MQIYLMYKFSDYKILKPSIEKFVRDNPKDMVFYFQPNDDEQWKSIADSKIVDCDFVVYIRILNRDYSDQKMDNIEYELKKAEESKKKIVIVELDADLESDPVRHDVSPSCIQKEDYSGRVVFRHKTIKQLDMSKLKEAVFNMDEVLFNKVSITPEYAGILLEEYRIMLDTSEKMMERRQNTNNFYVTLCTAILTAMVGLIATKVSTSLWCSISFVISVMLSFLCYNWKKTLLAYGLSNQAKYEVLNKIEQKLPASIFITEWEYSKVIHYTSYSKREVLIPTVFMCLFVLLSVAMICGAVLSFAGIIPNNIFI